MAQLNATHDPARRSWVSAANSADTDFPIQNLPFGVFSQSGGAARGGVAIGDQVFDLEAGLGMDLFEGEALDAAKAAAGACLDPLLELGTGPASALRARLSDLLRVGGPPDALNGADQLLVPLAEVNLLRPTKVKTFSDFSCSINHIGRLIATPWPALHHLPVAYNGRASSVRVSGAQVRRPWGQNAFPRGSAQRFEPEPALDYELEFGAYISGGNTLSQPLSLDAASDTLFGYCLVNDWSARGILIFENALGPFLGKSFLTTISPWIVTDEALAPFKIGRPPRSDDQPPVPAHLDSARNRAEGALDVDLWSELLTAMMQRDGLPPFPLARTNFKHMYWTFAQMAAHQASNGCNLETGDLIGSGTVSGPAEDAKACLMEATMAAGAPLKLPTGETRMWLEDGDTVRLRGKARREGFVSLGFGPCDGVVAAAEPYPA